VRTPVPSWAWRLLFVLLFLIYGTGFLLYVLLWIFVPQENEQ
jgi:phage shock protein PspC (stress-responsive transcriptional regulator)